MIKSCILLPVLLLLVCLTGTSCKTRKNMVYFQQPHVDTLVTQAKNYTPVFKVDDFLSIVILAEDPKAAELYNLPVNLASQNQGYIMGNPAPFGYLVNSAGEISLPILGTIKVAGKDRITVETEIRALLVNQLKSPTVQIQIQNFKVTVLGEVKTPGTFRIPNERITVLEAIGLAGDLKMSGVRQNVLVVRDSNGIKTEFRMDLTSSEVFNSPAYYLEQNDVVYVEPNAAGRSEGTVWKTTGAIFISLTSLVVTTITLIVR